MKPIRFLFHTIKDGIVFDNYAPGNWIVSKMHCRFSDDEHLVPTLVSAVTDDDIWIYPLNHIYGGLDQFSLDSTMLDKFLSNQKLVDGLHAGRGYILLDIGWESWCDQDNVSNISKLFVHKNIPLNRVVYATGAVNHSELFKPELGLIPMTLYAVESDYSTQMKKANLPYMKKDTVEKRFLCFNRRGRNHRLAMLAKIQEAKLLDQFYYSFDKYMYGADVLEVSKSMQYFYPEGGDVHSVISEIYHLFPMLLDKTEFETNLVLHHNPTDVAYYYRNTGVSLVTETNFYNREIFPTEKTFHAMRYSQPFVVVSVPRTLETLHTMGYQTFGKWIDEGYDLIENDNDRLNAITAVIADMASWSDEKFAQFLVDTKEVCEHNLHALKTVNRRYSQVWEQLFGDLLVDEGVALP